MEKRIVTCIECPNGCSVTVTMDGDKILSVEGNTCPRGKLYAENEMICPRRVITTTVKTTDGRMMAVKTERPVKKSEMFEIMKKISKVITSPKKIGEVVVENISEDINLVSAQDMDI